MQGDASIDCVRACLMQAIREFCSGGGISNCFYEDWAGLDGLIERLLVGLPAEVAVVRLSLVGTQNGPGPEHTSRANH